MKYLLDWLKFRIWFPLLSNILSFYYPILCFLSKVYPTQNYVFVFLGEFGYELLDWQGKIRSFKKNYTNSVIIAVSRNSSRVLYREADNFIGLDSLTIYQNAKADSYFARITKGKPKFMAEYIFSLKINRRIKKQVKPFLPINRFKFIFSNRTNFVGGVQFGSNMLMHGKNYRIRGYNTGIYETINLKDNDIRIPLEKINDNLGKEFPYLLFMLARRESHYKEYFRLNESELLFTIQDVPVKKILLEFVSSRAFDTEGSFRDFIDSNKFSYQKTNSLEKELVLIRDALACVFFTEGDLRSVTYLPPLIGKDVHIVCSESISKYSYLNHWNKNVFIFGGQMKFISPEPGVFSTFINALVKDLF